MPLLRQVDEEEEETVQTKGPLGQTRDGGANLEQRISNLRSGGHPLPQSVRSFFEPRFDHDFSKVRVHTGLAAEQSAREVNAHAYTVANNIVFGINRFAPASNDGRKLIAHELTHVVQQKGKAPVVRRKKTKTPYRAQIVSVKESGGTVQTYQDVNAKGCRTDVLTPGMEVTITDEFVEGVWLFAQNLPKAAVKALRGQKWIYVPAKYVERLPEAKAQPAPKPKEKSETKTEADARSLQGEEREKVYTKLKGLETVYEKYRQWKRLLAGSSMSPGVTLGAGRPEAEKARHELETQLKAHDFKGIDDFRVWIERYEKAFEQEAANIAKDLLAKYAGKLYGESERYKNPAEVAALHQKLGGVRTQYREFETNAKIWNEYAKASEKAKEQSRLPGQGHLRTSHFTSITPGEAQAARRKAEAAKAAAESQVKGMSSDHPIFQEEGLPLNKRINKAALAKASEKELGGLIQGHIQNRMKDISEARTEISEKSELIYKMDKLMPQFYAQQGIRPGSIHDMIIRDKMKSDAILKLVKGIALAIVAIALAVVSFGMATPAIIAAGATIAGAGLGAYMALEEYQEYTQQKKLADVGLSEDPSVVWLVIAVVGAALDVAAAVKALGPAAKAFNASGDLTEFTRAVRALEKANEIEAKVARAAENAASARKGFAEASTELTKAMAGKLYSFPGPLADPEVYKAVVKMARQAIKTKLYDAQKFIEELKLARVKAGFGDLTPEELAKAKQAWEEAKALEAADILGSTRLFTYISRQASSRGARYWITGNEASFAASKRGYHIYEYLDEESRLLYVGKSGGAEGVRPMNWTKRLQVDHINTSWIGDARRVRITYDLTEQEMWALEEVLIPTSRANLKPGEYTARFGGDVSANAASAIKRSHAEFAIEAMPVRE